jgi:type IV secretion system protein VirD4
MRVMKNYAGHRLSPWLGHLMVSRQETARALVTPGEVMQLPPADEIVLVSGLFPIRAKKARYFEDRRLSERVLPPPAVSPATPGKAGSGDWDGRIAAPPPEPPPPSLGRMLLASLDEDNAANSGLRREPDLPEHEDIDPRQAPVNEFELPEDDPDDEAIRSRVLRRQMLGVARQVSLYPDDGLEL